MYNHYTGVLYGGRTVVIKQIKLSNQAKERLSRLKGKTGIKNWNVLCRWAFCYSLAENTMPTDIPINADSNLEMSWYTFGGEYSALYEALIIAWCKKMGLPTDENTITKYFKLHLERGISYLSGTNFIKNLSDLLELGLEGKK
ncbi:MAG: sulfur modification protein DndE [Firmicutes bacterium]|nr:sulfur modification protein DndE [Bacillota bacterium]